MLGSVRPGVGVEVTREPHRRRRPDHALELPHRHPGLEDRPGAGYGNCVVFKPADLVPGSAWLLADILSRKPAGRRLQPRDGARQRVGQTLLNDPRIAAISFTGSVGTGQKVAAAHRTHGQVPA